MGGKDDALGERAGQSVGVVGGRDRKEGASAAGEVDRSTQGVRGAGVNVGQLRCDELSRRPKIVEELLCVGGARDGASVVEVGGLISQSIEGAIDGGSVAGEGWQDEEDGELEWRKSFDLFAEACDQSGAWGLVIDEKCDV